MTMLSLPGVRFLGKDIYGLGLVLALLAPTGGAFAQTISHVTVSKHIEYLQSSARDVNVNPELPGPFYGGPYGFSANVLGPNVGSITAPVITGPYNPAMSMHNGGTLVYNAEDRQWRFGTNGNDFGTSSLANLNAAFPNGTYTMTVNGVSIPLVLTGDAYPNAPRMTLSGGSWANGKYVIDPAQPLTITTNAFAAYGSNRSGVMVLGGDAFNSVVQGHDLAPSPNFLTMTVPANTFVNGQDYYVFASFQAVVDVKPTALAGTYSSARYEASTHLIIRAAPPVFPMTVNASIGPVVSNATASIQYRPQDVGTTGSVYTFFVAPSTKVLNAATEKGAQLGITAKGTDKDASVQCVLAQLNSSGQLQAVSASNLQAYVTGVLSSQGQAVTMLNNTLTANIAGTALYVGYGQNALNMLSAGLNRRAVTVPGTVQCDPEAPQTGWWWNTAEGGRGYSIEASGNHLFFAAYLYDVSGRATWTIAAGNSSLDGSLFTGRLESYAGGQSLFGSYKPPGPVNYLGDLTLAFNDSGHGTMVWAGGTVAIERFNIIPSGLTTPPRANQPENGWWWNPQESGRGYFLEWQGDTLFMAGYMYDSAGNPIWYLSSNSTANMQGYGNTWWQYANGQTMTGAYHAPQQVSNNVGSVTIQFQGAETGMMTLPGGRATPISRYRF